jgi:hypothetical protein
MPLQLLRVTPCTRIERLSVFTTETLLETLRFSCRPAEELSPTRVGCHLPAAAAAAAAAATSWNYSGGVRCR